MKLMLDLKQLHIHIKKLIASISQTTNPTIIVGLSGGADSVFLLHQVVAISKEMPCTIIAAHLEHDWRGQEDIIDSEFCRNLASKLGVKFVTKKVADVAIHQKWNGSQEELGRNQRRAFLEEARKTHKADAIALAHQAQDQEETFFIRLLRGASLEGLCSMNEISGKIIRPLLDINRCDIENWLKERNQDWKYDQDNSNRRFLRNRIRHELMPLLRTIDARVNETLPRTIKQLKQELSLIKITNETTFNTIFDTNGIGNLKEFKALPTIQQSHLVKKLLIEKKAPFFISKKFLSEALRFINAKQGGTHRLNQSWRFVKKQNLFWVEIF